MTPIIRPFITPPITHRVPTIRHRTIPLMEDAVARLVQGQRVIWFPAAFLTRYPPAKRQGNRFAAILWQNTILLYSLAASGELAVLEAVIEQLPVNEVRDAA